jgi:hypothetical protein
MAVAEAGAGVGRRPRLVFLAFQPHIFLSALVARALRRIILLVQRAVRRGLTNLQMLLLQVQPTVPLPMAAAEVLRRVLAERVDQPLARLVQQLLRVALAAQADQQIVPVVLAEALLVAV